MEFLEHKLPNGLTIVAERNSEAYSTAVGFFVETGARDETAALAGVSHFLEHMVFKGTPTRSAEDVNRAFDEMGAHYNAFTSEENTVYYAAMLPEHQTVAVELLADILRPSLRDEDFNTEKKVILEEIKMYEDQPPFGADDKCKAAHFGQHPLGHSVLGTAETVGALSVEAMRDYFRRRYSPGNITLVGSGRVDFDELVRTADRLCGAWQPVPGGRDEPPAADHSGLQCLHKDSATLEYVVQLVNGPDSRSRERFAAKILATVLGDDSGSRLYWALVDSGLAENASLAHYDYQGTGLYMTYMTCEAERTAANLAQIAQHLPPGRRRRNLAGRIESGQEQDQFARRAFERAAARPAVHRWRQLAATARISFGRRRPGLGRRGDGRRRAESAGASFRSRSAPPWPSAR